MVESPRMCIVALVHWLRVAYCLPLAICAVHTTLAAQLLPASTSQPIELTVIVDSPSPHWFVRITNGEDTVASTRLERDTTRFVLRTASSYFVNVFRSDTNVWANYDIHPSIVPCSSLTIICTSRGILCSDRIIERWSLRIQSYVSVLDQLVRSSASFESNLATADSLTTDIGIQLTSLLSNFTSRTRVQSEIVGPIATLIQTVRARSQEQSPNQEERQRGRLLRDQHLSDDTYRMARKLMAVLARSLATASRDTADVQKTLQIFMPECPCELASGLLARPSWNPGVLFQGCDEPLPRLIATLASQSTGYYCARTQQEIDALCTTLKGRVVRSFNILTQDNRTEERDLHPDSVYALHIWGTWCMPCLHELDATMNVSDSLEAMGIHVLHLADEPIHRISVWNDFVRNLSGEHYVVGRSVSTQRNVIEMLNVSLYPTLVIIGQNNIEILPRPFSPSALLDRARQLIQSDQR